MHSTKDSNARSARILKLSRIDHRKAKINRVQIVFRDRVRETRRREDQWPSCKGIGLILAITDRTVRVRNRPLNLQSVGCGIILSNIRVFFLSPRIYVVAMGLEISCTTGIA
jgi:hypothetical protein